MICSPTFKQFKRLSCRCWTRNRKPWATCRSLFSLCIAHLALTDPIARDHSSSMMPSQRRKRQRSGNTLQTSKSLCNYCPMSRILVVHKLALPSMSRCWEESLGHDTVVILHPNERFISISSATSSMNTWRSSDHRAPSTPYIPLVSNIW